MIDTAAGKIQGQLKHGCEDSFAVVFAKVVSKDAVISISRLEEILRALPGENL